MKKIIFIVTLILWGYNSNAQSIRKNYLEMTGTERADYISAVNVLATNNVIQTLADDHSAHFSSDIHTLGGNGSQFLSWHRYLILELEFKLKTALAGNASNYLNIPYWEWNTDNVPSSATFWNNTFLQTSSFPLLSITRSSMTGAFPTSGSTASLNTILGNTTFYINSTNSASNDFSHKLESGPHNNLHSFIGGTMGGGTSPRDPVFYLHHGMVDKLWQDWEDNSTGIQSVYPGTLGTNVLIHFNTTTVNNDYVDSRKLPRTESMPQSGRKMDVWFAKNNKVILDGANNTNFVLDDVVEPYLYRYAAATSPGGSTVDGQMWVGDLMRDASNNIISDTKGGFVINANVKCDFRAGGAIIFMPGFESKLQSNVSAKIITTANGFKKGHNSTTSMEQELTSDYVLYPNPVSNVLYIENGLIKNETVSINIYSMDGKIVKSIKDCNFNTKYSIDVESLTTGIYFVTVNRNGKLDKFKFTKQ